MAPAFEPLVLLNTNTHALTYALSAFCEDSSMFVIDANSSNLHFCISIYEHIMHAIYIYLLIYVCCNISDVNENEIEICIRNFSKHHSMFDACDAVIFRQATQSLITQASTFTYINKIIIIIICKHNSFWL